MLDKQLMSNIVQGLPTEQEMATGNDGDNLSANIVDPATGEAQGASLRKGEYVIDVPSLFGLGDGDYEKGLSMIKEMHAHLREKGLGMMDNQGLEGTQ